MDTRSLILNIALFLASGGAFVYGVVKFFKKKTALFKQLIVCGLGCMMLGRLFNIVIILSSGSIPSGFTVSKLGLIGGFMFLFSSSFGQMDGLVDGGEKEFLKYRIISLLAPLVFVVGCLPIYFSEISLENKILTAVITVFLALCSYFNLKHLIIPDVDMGIIKSIRGYNFTALILTVLSMAELLTGIYEAKIAESIIMILICPVYIAVLPILERGSKKWTI